MSLANSPLSGRVIRGGLALFVLVAVPWSAAHAKTPKHCRDIELKGAAGVSSQDIVRFRVRDSAGTLLDESCTLQVRYGESDVQFTQRIPGHWGFTTGSVCPNPPAPGPTPAPGPLPRENKTCSSAGLGYACKHEYRTKAGALPSDPAIQMVRVCCWKSPAVCNQADGSCCTGKKINAVDKKLCTAGANLGLACTVDANCDTAPAAGDGRCGRAPITIQTKVETNPYDPGDSDIPYTGAAATQIVVDPIGVVQRPSASTQGCRGSLGGAMTTYAAGRANALLRCEREDLSGPGCDTDVRDETLAKLEAQLRAVVAGKCELLGPPRRLGYAKCPAPCNGIVISVCQAGIVGQTCARDSDCDTSTNSGDGLCSPGNWNAAKDCLLCVADTTIDDAFDEAFGLTIPPVSPEAEKCQVTIGKVLVDLIAAQAKENVTCQKMVDGGKKPLTFCRENVCTGPPQMYGAPCVTDDNCLPPPEQLCKYADTKSLRQSAELSGRNHILQGCQPGSLAELDSCANDPLAEGDCIVAQGRLIGQSLADATYPEGIGHTVP